MDSIRLFRLNLICVRAGDLPILILGWGWRAKGWLRFLRRISLPDKWILAERLMMLSCSSVFVNRLPQPRSLMPEGREKLRFRVFCFGVEKPASYRAPEAMISRGVATSVYCTQV